MPLTRVQLIPPSVLILSFLATVMLFFGASIYSHHVASHIDQAALQISSDDAPSIIFLAGGRTEARHLEALLEIYLDAPPERKEALLSEVKNSREKLFFEFQSFANLPTYPEERAGWEQIRSHLSALRSAMDRLLALEEKHGNGASRGILNSQVLPEITQISQVAADVIEVDATHARQLAEEITRLRQRANLIEMVLDGIAAVLTLVILSLLLRFRTQRARILDMQAEALENRATALEHFSDRIAHDILSPLTATSIALEGVRLKLPKSEELLHRLINEGSSGLKRARRIVEDLLDFARAGAKPTQNSASEINAVLKDVLDEIKPRTESARISLTSESPPGELWVGCQPGILTSILSNLLNNAIKYMGDSPTRKIHVAITRQENSVRMEVRDSGPGIPSEYQANVFEPYFRAPDTKEVGLGIGLATVSRLVKSHSGKIGLHSNQGEGCTFWVELPSVGKPSEP